MLSRLLPLLSLPLLAGLPTCATFPQPRPATYGTVRVAFGEALDDADPWLPDQLIVLRKELRALQTLGPAFVETSEGDADVVIRPFDSKHASGDHNACGAGTARYHLGADYAEIDATCTHGDDELAAAVGHEVGHYLGMAHVCAPHEANATCDGAVRADYAMMNPRISYSTADLPEIDGGDSFAVDVATPTPTDVDVAEFQRVWHGRTSYAPIRRTARLPHRVRVPLGVPKQ